MFFGQSSFQLQSQTRQTVFLLEHHRQGDCLRRIQRSEPTGDQSMRTTLDDDKSLASTL